MWRFMFYIALYLDSDQKRSFLKYESVYEEIVYNCDFILTFVSVWNFCNVILTEYTWNLTDEV